MTTTFRPTLPSHAEEQHQTRDHGRETEQAQPAFVERSERRQAAPPLLRSHEREQPFQDQVESQTRKKICPGQSPKPPSLPLRPRSAQLSVEPTWFCRNLKNSLSGCKTSTSWSLPIDSRYACMLR